jgi:hypothetical protein
MFNLDNLKVRRRVINLFFFITKIAVRNSGKIKNIY